MKQLPNAVMEMCEEKQAMRSTFLDSDEHCFGTIDHHNKLQTEWVKEGYYVPVRSVQWVPKALQHRNRTENEPHQLGTKGLPESVGTGLVWFVTKLVLQ